MARDLLAGCPWLRRTSMRAVVLGAAAVPGCCGRALAYGCGWLAWWCDARGRRVVERRLARAVPAPDARARAVRRSYTDFALTLFDAARLPSRDWPRPGSIEIHDPHGVFRSRPLFGPAILVSAHSHWDLLAAALHRLGLTDGILAPTLSYGDRKLDAWLASQRHRWGCRTVALERAPLALLRALYDGQIIGLLIDRDYTGHGIAGRFLGQPTRLPSGPAALALQSGAPVIPLWLARRSTTRFALFVGQPLRPSPLATRSACIVDLTERIADALSRMLAAAPAQWVAFHDDRYAH
ncbi:MAG: lysophospholipid acyltransferase family protein [Planctomycetota bacterium]|nr:lysophospholipid acyltransferase family protein [Planctomycetota bacterium]MDW8372706.1 lysophospholipid acyltransferase family protein [Planctomycetota bacterium]